MKSCPQCGMQNTDDAAFCRGCGSRLAASDSAPETIAIQSAPEDTPVATPLSPVVQASVAPPRDAVDAQLSAQLGRSSHTLWGALAVVALIIIGGLGWLLGRGGQGSSAPTSELIGSTPSTAVSASDSSPTPDSSTSSTPSAAPTRQPAPTATPERWAGERYPQTRTQLLSESDVSGWSFDEVRYALNEIYARHGYDFQTPQVRSQFMQHQWYRNARVPGRSQSRAESLCSATENANRKLLASRRDHLAGGHGE
jgi:hypothetical protein